MNSTSRQGNYRFGHLNHLARFGTGAQPLERQQRDRDTARPASSSTATPRSDALRNLQFIL